MRNKINTASKESSSWKRRRTVSFTQTDFIYDQEVELNETIFDMVSKLFGKIAGWRLIPEGNIFNGDESGFTICHTPGKI